MINLKIDGKEVQVEKGVTILTAAEKAGIRIPTLCFLKKVSPTGACRVCVVDIEGADKPMTACNTQATEGMAVTTQSKRLALIRRQVVELLLVNHPLDCPVCDAGGECDLQNICYEFAVTKQPFEADDVNHGAINDWPLIQQVPNRCILCEKCIKVCHEVVGSSSLFLNEKGDRAFVDKNVDLCEFCGSCVSVCPTGTMISKPFKFKARPWELQKTATVCTTCSSHCQIDLHTKKGQVLRVTSEDEGTVNNGNLCIGGFFGHDYLNAENRLTTPLVKQGGEQLPGDWTSTLDLVVSRLGQIKAEAGADALAGFGSPQLTNEENYLFQKLFRVALGSNNLDSEVRFGALRTLVPLQNSLGLNGGSNRIDHIGKADAVLVLGADPSAEAPAIDWQIQKAARKGDAKLVIANLRKIKLTRFAETSLHYCPGSEVALVNALGRLILDRDQADERFLEQFLANPAELKDFYARIDLDQVAVRTGLSLEQLAEAANHIGQAESVALVFGSDFNRCADASAVATAVANLAMVSGALHGDAGGLFPIDEKGNTLAVLDLGLRPESLPGHQSYTAAKGKFEAAWNCQLPDGGKNALEILEGIEQGQIKALYLAATNPLVFPESGRWRKALAKVEFLVVQDILGSALTRMADVVLPGAAGPEKTGTVTSLDQRVNYLNRAACPPGEARADLSILGELYQRLTGLPVSEAELRQEMISLTGLYADTCVDITGRRFCLKQPYTPADKSLRFFPAEAGKNPVEALQVLSGKAAFMFGTTLTSAAAPLEVAPAPYVEMNPADAEKLGLADGQKVKLSNSAGAVAGPVKVSGKVPAGLLFVPYHYADLDIQQLISTESNCVAVEATKA